jgi:hypothetical protein
MKPLIAMACCYHGIVNSLLSDESPDGSLRQKNASGVNGRKPFICALQCLMTPGTNTNPCGSLRHEGKNRMTALLKSIEALCGRLNAGLAAVAVVLSILVAAQLTVRMPDLFQQAVDAENASMAANAAMMPSGSF